MDQNEDKLRSVKFSKRKKEFTKQCKMKEKMYEALHKHAMKNST